MAVLCSRHHNVIPVVVQRVGRAFASASSDPPSRPSGPVRYVQKSLRRKQPDNERKTALETTKTSGWGSIESNSPSEENHAESKTYPKNPKTLKEAGEKNSSDSSGGKSFSTVKWKSNLRVDHNSKDDEKGVEPDTTESKLDPEESLFGDPRILKMNTGDPQVNQSRKRSIHEDPSAMARNYMLSLLAIAPQTEQNLRKKLTKKNVPQEVIDETIKDLQRCGLQSDEEYAEVFARSRWTDNSWGPKRIKYELLRKGISEEKIESALVKLFQTSDTVGDQEEEEDLGKWGMTAEAAEHLVAQARRRWAQGDVKIDAKRRRLTGWLQRRGFSWTIVLDILKTIESEQAH